MDRRQFLKTASASTVLGVGASGARLAGGGMNSPSETPGLRKPLCSYTADDHRQRLEIRDSSLLTASRAANVVASAFAGCRWLPVR